MTKRKAITAIAIVGALGATGAAYALRARPQAGEVLRIGAVLANPPASDGARSESVRQGFALAQKNLENEWAGAVRLELVYKDSGGSAAVAREKLDELHKQGVDVIAEIVGDDVVSGCAAEVRKNKMLVVSAIESAPDLGGLLGPTSFRIGGGDAAESVELAHWARELRAQRPLIVGTPSTKRLVDAFAQAFGGLGRDLMLEIGEGGEGAQQVAERAARRSCDVVVLLVDSKTAPACLKALRESAATAWVLGTHVLGEPALMSSAKDLLKRAFFLTRASWSRASSHVAPARRLTTRPSDAWQTPLCHVSPRQFSFVLSSGFAALDRRSTVRGMKLVVRGVSLGVSSSAGSGCSRGWDFD